MLITKKEFIRRHIGEDVIGDQFIGGVAGCPSYYGLENIRCMELDPSIYDCKCEICWLQLINESKYIDVNYKYRCQHCAYLSTDDVGYWWCEDWQKRCCEVQDDECDVSKSGEE